jgi:hypothetical protein
MSRIQWHDEAVINGINVKAFFFDGNAAKDETDLVRRAVPMLADAPVKPTVLATEQDRKNFYFDILVAQPDAVFAHGSGLVCVEYKFVGYRDHSRQSWRTEIRLGDMLQSIIAAFVVAQSQKRVTACVLRYHNVAYLLTPSEELVRMVTSLAPMAKAYYAETRRVAAKQLAIFTRERVQSAFPRAETERAAEGRVAHDALLRRDS